MSEYEKIEKKQKRSTIDDALIAANLGKRSTQNFKIAPILGEYIVFPQNQNSTQNDQKILTNDNKKPPNFYNPTNNYQVPNNFMPYNTLNSNINNVPNNPLSTNPLYNIFQKSLEKPSTNIFPHNDSNMMLEERSNEQNSNFDNNM